MSDDGRVFSEYRTGGRPYRELKQQTLRWGYKSVTLAIKEKDSYERVLVHVLVLETFIGPRPSPNHVSRHKDGSRDNNVVSNLIWGTASDNQIDKLKLDGGKILKEQQAIEIKQLLSTDLLQREIADMFNVSRQTVNDIANGRTWTYV